MYSYTYPGVPYVVLQTSLHSIPFSVECSFNFSNCLQVILDAKSLSTELVITNTDKIPFSFSTALHTYFRVRIFLSTIRHLVTLLQNLGFQFLMKQFINEEWVGIRRIDVKIRAEQYI